jgi:uncharacterized membrane protein
MNSELINQVSGNFGANGLPYVFPIHPNLVHLTLGLFIVGIGFDIVGALFLIEKPVFKFFALPATRAGLFDVGWYNTLASAIITFLTVATGFYEIMLAQPPANIKSAWGLGAETTMLWHGVGGVLLLVLIVGMTVWRSFQRFRWRKDAERQVQWGYLYCGMVILFIMFLHGTLGAHLAADFGVHNTAARLLRIGQDPNLTLK